MASVKLTNLTKIYGGNPQAAVKNLNLTVADREFVVLVGSSGCGKTTTLRMVAGLERLTDGQIQIGKWVKENTYISMAPQYRDVAFVFQNYALWPHMTVRENMSFGLKIQKIHKHEIEYRVFQAADILGIVDLLDRKPKTLSGGQRQRVAVGRAIVRKPAVFLFDEPLSNLDAKLRVQMRKEIKDLHNRLGATTIYVTHDQIEAMTMADRIVVMDQGVVQQVGTPAEIYREPANDFVADFMGTTLRDLARLSADLE